MNSADSPARQVNARWILWLGLPALILAATLGLWVRSFFLRDDVLICKPRSRSVIMLTSFRGRLELLIPAGGALTLQMHHEASRHLSFDPKDKPPPPQSAATYPIQYYDFGYFTWDYCQWSNTYSELRIRLPIWLLVVLELALLGAGAYRFRRSGRACRDGICQRCRYDLRATPRRCPECGAGTEKTAMIDSGGPV
jgi:hypothetical protein